MLDSEDKGNPLFDRISYFFLLGILVLILTTFQHYGISWDEPAQREVGTLSLSYYASGFHDLRATESSYFDRIYGGFFEIIAELAVRIVPSHPYETRHLINALAGFLGIFGCWRLARHIGGRFAGLCAVIMMILFPTYTGHMFNNPKDIPFAAAYIWSVYFLILALSDTGKPSLSAFLKFAATAGVTAGIRVGGLVLFAVAIVGWAVYVLLRWAHRDPRRLHDSLIVAFFLLTAFVLACALMLVFWPWALQDPITNVPFALRFFSNWNGNHGDPWYLFKCFSVKLPEAILVGLSSALLIFLSKVKDIVASFRGEQNTYRSQYPAFAILVSSFLMPAAYIIIKRSVLYNEMRQVIFISLPIVVCSAIAFSFIFKRLLTMSRVKYLLLPLLLCLLVLPFYSISRLYPYHYIYCNNISGGLSGIGKEYTYEYYLHSYRALSFQFRNYMNQKNAWVFEGRSPRVFVHGSPQCFAYYLPPSVIIVDDPDQADYGVYCPLNYSDKRPSREIGAVSRCGLKLSTLRLYHSD